MATPTLSERETATILAALRTYQTMRDGAPIDIENIATDGGRFASLGDEEIDQLAERINVA